MPKGNGKALTILANLADYSEKVLSLIAADSDKGRLRLIDILKKATESYQKPLDSKLLGWIYAYTRIRGEEVQQTVKNMEAFPSACTRLQEFKQLISGGEWKKGSFNYYLFNEVVAEIPGYEPLEKKHRLMVYEELKKLLLTKIDEFIRDTITQQKMKESRDLDLRTTQSSHSKEVSATLEQAVICNSIPNALERFKQNKAATYFSLSSKDKRWSLYWIDLLGETRKLPICSKLSEYLQEQGVANVNDSKLTSECIKARDTFLAKIKLLINPPLDNQALINKGTQSTFVLRTTPQGFSLCWLTMLSREMPIDLSEQPQLLHWLNSQGLLFERQTMLLKSYLMQVNTAKPLTKDDLVKIEQRLFYTPAVRETKKLDLQQFAEIENCLKARISKPKKVGKIDLEQYSALTDFFATVKVPEKLSKTEQSHTPGQI